MPTIGGLPYYITAECGPQTALHCGLWQVLCVKYFGSLITIIAPYIAKSRILLKKCGLCVCDDMFMIV